MEADTRARARNERFLPSVFLLAVESTFVPKRQISNTVVAGALG